MYLDCQDCGLNKKINLINRVQDTGDEPLSMPNNVQDSFYDQHYHNIYVLRNYTVEQYSVDFKLLFSISLDIQDPDPSSTFCTRIMADNPRERIYVLCKHD